MNINWKDNLKFDINGLIPVIAQDSVTKEVLMLAYMNKEALERTIETGLAYYYSRSRKRLWLKGETSGNVQVVKDILYDCDCDTLLLQIIQKGGACHTGHLSCFFRSTNEMKEKEIVFDPNVAYSKSEVLNELINTISDRCDNPKEGSYTNYLFDKGLDKILKKVGEETAEVIIASKNTDNYEVCYEISDLIYHLSVLLVEKELTWGDIFDELKKRRNEV